MLTASTIHSLTESVRNILTCFLLLTVLFATRLVIAAPLGTTPTIEDRNLRLILDFRSDLWTSPYAAKSNPVRIMEGELRLPLYKSETWTVSFDADEEGLNFGRTDLSLGKEQMFIGNSLRSDSLGFGAQKDFADGARLDFFGSWATASDCPYCTTRDEWFEGMVIYYSSKIENHRWILAVNQSNNRGISNGRPFPYIGISYQRDKDFSALFGFPFLRLTWDTPETWQKTVHVNPFGADVDVEKNLPEDFVFNGVASLSTRSYLPTGRVDDNDRLFYQELLVEGAFKKNVTDFTGIVFALGYSFDRRIYESEVVYSPNSRTTRLDNDFYGRLGVEFRR